MPKPKYIDAWHFREALDKEYPFNAAGQRNTHFDYAKSVVLKLLLEEPEAGQLCCRDCENWDTRSGIGYCKVGVILADGTDFYCAAATPREEKDAGS